MNTIEVVNIEKSALEKLIYQVSKKAYLDGRAECEERDEMLNIAQICERTGMTRHTFNILRDKHKIKCIGGKYSLGSIRKAMQS